MPPLVELDFSEAPLMDLTNVQQQECFFDARERQDDDDDDFVMRSRKAGERQWSNKQRSRNHRRQQQQRRVSFASFYEVKETIHCKDYTAKEKARSFYSAKEFKILRRERQESLRRMQDNAANMSSSGSAIFSFLKLNAPEACMRGLENKTYDGSRRRLMHITQAVDAVLDEQSRQLYEYGALRDWGSISRAYRQVSAYCSCEAQVRGQEDFQAVRKLLLPKKGRQ